MDSSRNFSRSYPGRQGSGTAPKQYMDQAGFNIDLDIADPGRFFGSVYGPQPGPDADLNFWITGRDQNYLATYMRWFSTQPFTPLAYLGHPAGQAEADARRRSSRASKNRKR